MKKTTIILSIILILSIIFVSFDISGFVTDEFTLNNNYTHSWTKAICSETYCQDYEMFCNGNKLIRQTAITGAVMNIPENWVDPREKEDRERVCE